MADALTFELPPHMAAPDVAGREWVRLPNGYVWRLADQGRSADGRWWCRLLWAEPCEVPWDAQVMRLPVGVRRVAEQATAPSGVVRVLNVDSIAEGGG